MPLENQKIGRKEALVQIGVGIAAAAGAQASTAAAEPPKKPLNVLFLITDDMRSTITPNGGPIQTPNLEKLAQRGTTFRHTYCQQAVCGPSRASLLTGARPDQTHIHDLTTHFRKFLPDVVTLPQHFKNHGYATQSLSKVFHDGVDDPPSWSIPHWQPHAPDWHDPERVARVKADAEPTRGKTRGPSWEASDTPDAEYIDAKTAAQAIAELGKRKAEGKPFFMAVGFYKPHLPFVAPQHCFDRYPRETVALAAHPGVPKDVPPTAYINSGELRTYSDIADGTGPPVTEEQARDLRRAYYAAASFMDSQVGRVLDELDRLGLRDTTIVVYTVDHGWQLGENGQWGKALNSELATRVPFIISVPGRGKDGTRTDVLVESVDIYPTLCSAAGLPTPPGKAGVDLMPIVDGKTKKAKDAALSQFQRTTGMGYSMRTEEWRYTEWAPGMTELYDEKNDPDETVNLAADPKYRDTVAEQSRRLHALLKQTRVV